MLNTSFVLNSHSTVNEQLADETISGVSAIFDATESKIGSVDSASASDIYSDLQTDLGEVLGVSGGLASGYLDGTVQGTLGFVRGLGASRKKDLIHIVTCGITQGTTNGVFAIDKSNEEALSAILMAGN